MENYSNDQKTFSEVRAVDDVLKTEENMNNAKENQTKSACDNGASQHKIVPCVSHDNEKYLNVEFKRDGICHSSGNAADSDNKSHKLESAFELQPVKAYTENSKLKNSGTVSDNKLIGNNEEATTIPKCTSAFLEDMSSEAFVFSGGEQINNEHNQLNENSEYLNSKCKMTEDDTVCGIGFFKPQWIQKYATPRIFLTLYCIVGIIQGSYYTYFSGIMSTIEKRFAFTSQMSSSIYVIKEASPLLLGIPIGYFGGMGHKPRIIAFGMFLTIISCIIHVIPYFIYGPATNMDTLVTRNATGPEVCDLMDNFEKCEKDDRPPTVAVLSILLLGSCIEGFGGLALFACGISYIDDNARKKNSPVYIGIAHAFRLFGPIFGYLLSSTFLNMNENPFVDPGYGPKDPRWIGGWWMGFVLEAVLLTVVSIPMAMFPRRLPNYAVPSNTRNKPESFRKVIAGLIPTLKRLLKNPIFVLLTINTVVGIIGNGGYFVMLPKYAENQFRLTAADASLLSGPPGLAAVQLATVLGSVFIWKYKPSGKFLTAGIVISEVISAAGYLILLLPKCETVNLHNAGTNADGLILWNECNANCSCTTAEFNPFCGPDGKTTYFSPCHAGCAQTEEHNNTQVYHNCSCFANSESLVMTHSVEKGFCFDENCWNQALTFMIILPIVHFITSFLRIGHSVIQLRSVSPKDKSAALGTFDSLISVFGFIPYPIIFGALIDSVCLVWEKSCGETGNCWFYDMDKFNFVMHGLAAIFCMFAALSMLGIYFLTNRLPDLYEEEVEEDDVAESMKRRELETK